MGNPYASSTSMVNHQFSSGAVQLIAVGFFTTELLQISLLLYQGVTNWHKQQVPYA